MAQIFRRGDKTYIIYSPKEKKEREKRTSSTPKSKTPSSTPQVVVAGYPEIKGEQAQQVKEYSEKVGRVEIKEIKTSQGDVSGYQVKPSSEEYIKQRMAYSQTVLNTKSERETEQRINYAYAEPIRQEPPSFLQRTPSQSETTSFIGVDTQKVNAYTLGVLEREEPPKVFSAGAKPDPYSKESLNLAGQRATQLLSSREDKTTKQTAQDLFIGVGGASAYVLGSAFSGFKSGVEFFVKPRQSIVGATQLFKSGVADPLGTTKMIVSDVRDNPIKFGVEQFTVIKGAGLITKAPRVIIEEVKGARASYKFKKMVETPTDIFSEQNYFRTKPYSQTAQGEVYYFGRVQYDLYGNPALAKPPSKSPLGLDTTSFYKEVLPDFKRKLESGEVIKGTPKTEFDYPRNFGFDDRSLLNPDYIRVRLKNSDIIKDVPNKEFLKFVDDYRDVEVLGRVKPSAQKKIIHVEVPPVAPKSVFSNNIVGVEIIPGSRYVSELITRRNIISDFRPSILRLKDSLGVSEFPSSTKLLIDSSIISGGASAIGKLGKVSTDKFFLVTSEGRLKPISEQVKSPTLEQPLKFEALNINILEPVSVPLQSPVISQRSKPSFRVGLQPVQDVVQVPDLAFDTPQSTNKIFYPRFKPLKSPIVETSKIPRIKPFVFRGRAQGVSASGYFAEVRRRGKFVNIGRFGSEREAFQRASLIVGTSASASFRVKRESGGLVTSPQGFLGGDFRPSKREHGVFVEKKERRIKSAGELSEITYKGLLVRKIKRKRGSLL